MENELNKWIVEVLFEGCWHEPRLVDVEGDWWRCQCGIESTGFSKKLIFLNPDYCSSLDLARLLETKMLEMDLGQAYIVNLAKLLGFDTERWNRQESLPEGWTAQSLTAMDVFILTTATALQRCTAVRAAVEGK